MRTGSDATVWFGASVAGKEREAAGRRKQGESEAAMSCGPRKLRGAESARKEQKTRQQKDLCSGRRRKQEVRLERVDVGNEVVLAYVAEEGRDGSWASRVRKGEATVGCGRASCGVARACRKKTKWF